MRAAYERRPPPSGDRSWRVRASCRGRDPSPWFSGQQEQVDKARAVCMACPVRSACLVDRLEWEELIGQVDDGMFGGRTPRERKVLLRHRGASDPQVTGASVTA